MKFAIFSEVEHAQFGRGVVRGYNSLTSGYTVLFGSVNQFMRTVKEQTLSKPSFKLKEQCKLHHFL